MDLENQKRVKNLADEHGAENVVIIFGAAEAESAVLAAETVTNGDPTYAGPLTGIALGLSVFHAVEPEFKEAVSEDEYEEQVGMMEMVLNVDEIITEMSNVRSQFCKYL